ncbi:MAG: hypothetical protein KAI66_13455 [Lentisphaeria bacterium]|nr:hypothetical protein [Lentisphaeria bacterium]
MKTTGKILAILLLSMSPLLAGESKGADSAEEQALRRRIAAGQARYEALLATRWGRQEARLKKVADRWVTEENVPRAVADAALKRMQTRFRQKGSADQSKLEKELLQWALNKLVE